jgi:hypothetical protein
MSFEEKGVWAALLSSAAGYVAYLAIVVPRLFHTPASHVSYLVPLVLTTIASSVVALVVRSVAEYVSRWCVIGGATAGFIGAVNHWNYFWIGNAIYLGFVLWIVVGSVLRLVAYHRGL